MTRDEHLAWCKQRALDYVDQGDLSAAFASMCSDLDKHERTRDHPGVHLGGLLLLGGQLSTPLAMRRFIEGFN